MVDAEVIYVSPVDHTIYSKIYRTVHKTVNSHENQSPSYNKLNLRYRHFLSNSGFKSRFQLETRKISIVRLGAREKPVMGESMSVKRLGIIISGYILRTQNIALTHRPHNKLLLQFEFRELYIFCNKLCISTT